MISSVFKSRSGYLLHFMAFFLAFLLFSGLQCKKQEAPPSAMPDITKEGLNTFGCTVNGELWLPETHYKGLFYGTEPPVSVTIDPLDGWQVKISAIQDPEKGGLKSSLDLNFNDVNRFFDATLSGEYENQGAYIDFRAPGSQFCIYKTTDVFRGSVHILKFDTSQKIIAGLFNFDAITDKGDTVRVTDGRFDLTYPQ